MTFHFVTNTIFCSDSFVSKLFFSSQKEKQRDQKRISDHYFCTATELKALWKYYLNVKVFFLFLVTSIPTEGRGLSGITTRGNFFMSYFSNYVECLQGLI